MEPIQKKHIQPGILHDIMKNSPPEEQLAVLEQAGAVLTADERANPKLWHAMAGEAYARTALQVKDADILRAIRYHTTARADQSVLEKVLYIADFISADRDYNGVEEMCAAVGVSLEAAMLKGMRFCITDLVQSGQVIHTDSVGRRIMRSLSLELRRKGWWTMHKTERRVQIGMLLYCLFVSFCFLTICTKSSFLYPLNNGSDIQCFFTVGKGMMHGLVPYRDLVEQKGPLLYFLYGLASLVSSRSFFGVYLLEILSYTFFFVLFL